MNTSSKSFPRARRYRGKRFLIAFFIAMILVLVTGMALTWTLGKAMAPALKERRLKQRAKEEAQRQQALRESDRAEGKPATTSQ